MVAAVVEQAAHTAADFKRQETAAMIPVIDPIPGSIEIDNYGSHKVEY